MTEAIHAETTEAMRVRIARISKKDRLNGRWAKKKADMTPRSASPP